MKIQALSIALTCISFSALAQTWKLNIETGVTLGRLIPVENSSPKGGTLRYGYSQPGMYIAPELQLKLNEHIDAGLNYQYASVKLGTQHVSNNSHINNYDGIDVHSFNLGLYVHKPVFREHMKAGAFVKGGLAYNKMVSMGSGGGGGEYGYGAPSPYPSYSGISRVSDFNAVMGKWTPTSTLGITIATNSKNWIADRLSFRWAATVSWNNIYNGYSRYDYYISTGNTTESGAIQYQGMPFVMQVGANYRIFGFGKRENRS